MRIHLTSKVLVPTKNLIFVYTLCRYFCVQVYQPLNYFRAYRQKKAVNSSSQEEARLRPPFHLVANVHFQQKRQFSKLKPLCTILHKSKRRVPIVVGYDTQLKQCYQLQLFHNQSLQHYAQMDFELLVDTFCKVMKRW